MNKHILSILTVVLLCGTVTSCSEDFLNEVPYSSYSKETLGDTKGIEASLKGLHYLYGQLWTWSDQQGWLSIMHVGTDVASPGGVQGVEIPFYRYGELTSSNAGVYYMWSQCYKIINNANSALETIGEDGDPAKIAEARFFRGFIYNYLATLWGDVPLMTQSTSTAGTDYTRTPVDRVNAVIVEDLAYAAANLPDIGATVAESRANKYMAMQALGEVYLRLGRASEAEAILDQVINSKKFSLINNRYGIRTSEPGDFYHDMFIYGNQRRSQGNTETIWTFELEYNAQVTGGYTNAPQHRRVFNPSFHNIPGMTYDFSRCDSIGGRGNGRCRPSGWVANSLYDDDDIRNSRFNMRRVLYYNVEGWSATYKVDARGFRVSDDDPSAVRTVTVGYGDPIVPTAADTSINYYPCCTKWDSFDPTDTWGWACIKDFPMMRLGETYLLRAEARLKQGNTSGAADDINVLRQRAFAQYPAKGAVSASDITMDFILDERARELLLEEFRRMTLMRTGTLIERAALNKDVTPQGSITGLTSTHLLWPIPLNEIQRNTDAELLQNPGYTN